MMIHRPHVKRGHRRGERGSTTVEAAGYTALMLLVILVVVQAAVWALADVAARNAAHHGLQTARVAGGTEQAGQAAAADRLEALNPNGVTNVTVTVDRTPETTTVTVRGDALRVVPVVTIPVSVQAHSPTEPET